MHNDVLAIVRSFVRTAFRLRRLRGRRLSALAFVMPALMMGLPKLAGAQTVTSLTFSPNTIVSGSITTATVTLSGPAPTGGASVAITQSGKTYGTAVVPAGQTGVSISWEWFETQTATVHYAAEYAGSGTGGDLNVTFAPWTSVGVGVASDGTSRVLSVRNDGVIGIWFFDASDVQTSFGRTAVHASSTQGTWAAKTVAAASDGTSRILWARSDGALDLWTVSSDGSSAQPGTDYGPYSDGGKLWSPQAVGVAGDGTSRVLWTRADGAAGLWTLDGNGTLTQVGPIYGPYSGWTAKAVGVASDGTSRVLWTRSDGAAGLWSFGVADASAAIGPTYGPFSSASEKWSATAVGLASDGTSRVLWTRADGAAGLWSFGTNDAVATVGATYGPYSGTGGLWTAKAVAVGTDGTARVLWTRPDTSAGLWSFGANDSETTIGTVYGPY